jgi:predicted permease
VLAFTASATLLAGCLAALGPAILATRANLLGTLAEARAGVSSRRSRSRTLLTVGQAAMSVVLLVGAGLFVRSLNELRALDLGVDVDPIVLARLELVDETVGAAERNRLYVEVAERIGSLPFVEATAITDVPFLNAQADRVRVPGRDSIPRLPGGGPYYFAVTPGYFEALGIELLRGRPITEADGQGAPLVAVVSETMARTLWPRGDALGACIQIGTNVQECTTVVGVAEDAARSGYQDEPFMAYYLAFAQRDVAAQGLYIRTSGRAADAIPVLTAELRAWGPVRYANVRSLREILAPQARSWTLGATMFTVFGVLALVVAAIGLYSVLAFDVAQRTRELGIRTALGAAKARLLGDVVWDAVRLAGAGVVFGLVTAWLAAPLVQDLLFQVSPREPMVLGTVAVVLIAVALAASLGPGLRATRVDPMISLRSE